MEYKLNSIIYVEIKYLQFALDLCGVTSYQYFCVITLFLTTLYIYIKKSIPRNSDNTNRGSCFLNRTGQCVLSRNTS